MKKPVFFILMLFLGITSVQGQSKDKTYVLVHGAWHGAWCWYKIIPLMEGKGYKVMAIDLPSHGNDTNYADSVIFSDYVEKVTKTANNIEGEVILVGHSMGGTVISQAAEILGKVKVAKLIYIDAFLPQNGESVSSLAGLIEASLPKDSSRMTIGNGLIVSKNGKTSTFKPEIADILFYHDCTQSDKDYAHKHLSRQSFAPLGTPVKVTEEVFGNIPKYFILCTESKDLDKSLLPTRVKCEKTVKLKSGHSPFFSMPDELAQLLVEF
ncbi:alpha/beta fold hydrolase [Aquiflexum gelatinilyticum]|uniref:Alpha/beta fold hydrolase n=1 Tax=Aquiflexum gelatinilyticum TaxID=2961943 RepID=A0A9X2P904_9BACT|nr:alpha/beta fold hydrolase [Aquiflexum gelatinilyticum]MCR9014305.1 alpha/beta fold hydrolase [Aquiflexum gelatinilyticum]